MDKVFVVVYGYDYECDNVIGVTTTFQKALDIMNEHANGYSRGDFRAIYQMPLNEISRPKEVYSE